MIHHDFILFDPTYTLFDPTYRLFNFIYNFKSTKYFNIKIEVAIIFQ